MALRAEDVERRNDGVVDLDRDRLLVVRFQQGDDAAFAELYERYFPRVRLYCLRRVRDGHVAEELAQETFVRALSALPRFSGDRKFYPWMTVIAQRVCIDHHRRLGRVQPAADIDTGSVEADHEAVFEAVDRDLLAAALDRVADRHREVLALREARGWSYQEIADHLEVPVTTVEALLHRARRSLRRQFLHLAGGARLAAIPAFGVIAARAGRIRTRLGAMAPLDVAHLVGPAVATIATAGLIALPLVDADPPSEPNPSNRIVLAVPSSTVPAPPTSTEPTEPASPGDPNPRPSTPPTSVSARPSDTVPAPAADLGVAEVYGPEGEAHIQSQIDSKPVQLDLGPLLQLGVDPAALLGQIVESIASQLGGTP